MAWSILPVSPNAFANLGSERAHSFLILSALATLRASYTWLTHLGDCDTNWELEEALRELQLTAPIFWEFHGFSVTAHQWELHEQIRHAASRLVPQLVIVMREKYPSDGALAEAFVYPNGRKDPRGGSMGDDDDSDDAVDYPSIELWCAEGCPLYC